MVIPGRRSCTSTKAITPPPKWWFPRITSYNVCYTKLLRVGLSTQYAMRLKGFLIHSLLTFAIQSGIVPFANPLTVSCGVFCKVSLETRQYMLKGQIAHTGNHHFGVITSYSIHYTKLYDSIFQPLASQNLVYIRYKSPAKILASSPPVPARISSTAFLSSSGSAGSNNIFISSSSGST